jgi:hypothetical protein
VTEPDEPDVPPGQPVPAQELQAAESDLARIREQLVSLGGGQTSASQVQESVQGYLDAHDPALRAAAASLGEEVRRQTLDELYKWRAQLSAQLTHRATTGDGAAGRPPGDGTDSRPSVEHVE